MLTKKTIIKSLVSIPLFITTQFMVSYSYANTFGDVEIAVTNDDNLSRSDYGPDKKSDTATEVYIDYGKFYELKDNWSATTVVFSQYSNYNKYSKLSTFTVGASGSFRKKLGLGAYSSSISTSLSLSNNNVSDSKRKNNLLELTIDWNKRLNDEWELTAGISLDDSDASNSVFNTSGTSLFFLADYTINEKFLASFGISQRSGEIISVTGSSNPNYTYITWSAGSKTVSDDVFGSGLWAYRLDATTMILNVALSYAVNDESSVNVSYEKQNSSLDYGIDYNNNIIQVSYIYGF